MSPAVPWNSTPDAVQIVSGKVAAHSVTDLDALHRVHENTEQQAHVAQVLPLQYPQLLFVVLSISTALWQLGSLM